MWYSITISNIQCFTEYLAHKSSALKLWHSHNLNQCRFVGREISKWNKIKKNLMNLNISSTPKGWVWKYRALPGTFLPRWCLAINTGPGVFSNPNQGLHFAKIHKSLSHLDVFTGMTEQMWLCNLDYFCDIQHYPFLNFNGCTVEVYKWISNFIPHFMIDVITYPCWD